MTKSRVEVAEESSILRIPRYNSRSKEMTEMPNDPRTTVLVVDDDAEFSGDLAGALDSSGYRVFQAPDVQSAYSIMDAGKRIDVMVIDLVLPDKSGLELIHTAKRKEQPAKLLATTEILDPLHLEIATYMGADAAIRKFARSPLGVFPKSEWVSAIDTLRYRDAPSN
jgi:CheY-like chemotaxis protein